MNRKFIFNFLLTNVIKKHENLLREIRKNTENVDPKIFKIKNKRLIMQSKCSDCRIKKSRFVKEQEGKGLLSNLGIKTPSRKIPLLNVIF